QWIQLRAHGQAGSWCGRRKHQVVSHRGHLYLLGGYAMEGTSSLNLNDVWRSDDGAHWSQITPRAPWSGRDGHVALEHLGSIYIMGGTQDLRSNDNDVWRSANGVNWVQVCRAA
ncbi:cell wall surface anchor family protein, partial [Tribonema minus]